MEVSDIELLRVVHTAQPSIFAFWELLKIFLYLRGNNAEKPVKNTDTFPWLQYLIVDEDSFNPKTMFNILNIL